LKVQVRREHMAAVEDVCFQLSEATGTHGSKKRLVERFIVEMWMTSMYTGLRLGEVIALSHDQVHLSEGVLVVDRAMRVNHPTVIPGTWWEVGDVLPWALHLPKMGKLSERPEERRVRRVPISSDAERILAPVLARAKQLEQSLLWPDEHGAPKAKKNVQQAMSSLAERLGETALYCGAGREEPVATRRGRARNTVAEVLRERGDVQLPADIGGVTFKSGRGSFSTVCNDLSMTDATRNHLMGHVPEGVGAKHYVMITDEALQHARQLLSRGRTVNGDE
jgi:integrase